MTKKIKVAAYCRVSTSSADQENSFENQKSYFDREISKSNEYALYRIYADRGISGTSLHKREEFARMLFDAGLTETKVSAKKTVYEADSQREPLFNRIFVKNTSRFARNVLVVDILRELLKKGVHVYFLDIDLLFDSIEKEFLLNLFLNFAQQESIDKSAKVRFGIREGARKGNIFVNTRLFGYFYDLNTKELTIRDDEAAIVRTIFDLYAKGLGIRRILNHLEESGYKTRENKPFVASAIKRILANEKYCGILARNKYDTGVLFNKKTTPQLRERDEWEVFEDRIPSIISRELFDEVNKIRSSKVNHVNQKGIYKGISEFAGKIHCSKCGKPYTRNIDKGRVFFNCSTKKTKGTVACDGKNINESTIFAHIDDLRSNGLIAVFAREKDKHAAGLSNQIDELRKRINTPAVEELEARRAELNEIESEEETLVRLVVKGQVKESLFDELKVDIDMRRKAVLVKIERLSQTNDSIYEEIATIEDRIKKLEALTVKDDYMREEIIELITRFIVSEGEDETTLLTFELGVLDDLAAV